MAKLTKKETAFNERDALTDMREAERKLLRAYAGAAAEGGSRRLRTLLAQNFAAAAEDMYAVDCAMQREDQERGGVSAEEIKRAYTEFSRRGADLSEN